jgi:amino-acid N-acetyltransferase
MNALTYRRARPSDTRSILNLIGFYSAKGLLLPRPFSQIIEKIRDFHVAVEESQDGAVTVKGVVALHPVGEDLAEVRSLAVEEALAGKGIGKQLMKACIEDAHEMRLNRIFALTYQTVFFNKLGFQQVEKLTLPQKIWGDCVHCTKFSDCDEVAMLLSLGHA